MVAVKLPEINSGSMIFKDILSIWLVEQVVILVGCKIKRKNELEMREFYDSQV